MRVLVDTSVWSLALRRRPGDLATHERALSMLLRELIAQGITVLLGVVRQELLSGTRDAEHFNRLRDYLRDFEDEPPVIDDYEEAARCATICANHGVDGSPVDMLICGFAISRGMLILTTDQDFARYTRYVPARFATTAGETQRLLKESPRKNGA